MNDKILEVLKTYTSIIDFDEPDEVMHLIADLEEVINEKIEDEDYYYGDRCNWGPVK